MTEHTTSGETASEERAEQRAYLRLPLRLDIELGGPHWPARHGEVRDFSPGGLFVSCSIERNDPKVGGHVLGDPDDPRVQLAVRFSVPAMDSGSGEDAVYELSARVARAFEAGLGIAFVEPDSAAIEALQALAQRQLEQASERTGTSPELDEAQQRELRGAARDLAARQLATFLSTYFTRVEQALLTAARETTRAIDQQSYFESLNALDRQRDAIADRFQGLIKRHFDELGEPLAAVERPPEDPAESGLSLVDKDEFEDFLTVSEIVARAESSMDTTLFELSRRLDHLSAVRIRNDNNPIGPLAVGHAFRASLSELALEHAASMVIYDAFNHQVLNELSAVYYAVNHLLQERGLSTHSRFKPEPAAAPVVRQTRRREPGRSEEAAGQDAWGAVESVPGYTPAHPAVGSPAAGATSPPGAVPGAGPGGVPVGFSGDGAVAGEAAAAAGSAVPSGALAQGGATSGGMAAAAMRVSRPVPPHLIGAPAAFGAAQSLFGIQRQQAMHGDVLAGRAPSAGPTFAPEEVTAALSSVPLPGSGDTGPGGSFRERLLAVLGAQGTGRGKRLDDDTSDMLELIGGLFRAIAADQHVDPVVKGCLGELEPSVQRVALVDPSFLSAREHPVRRLINGLGELDAALGRGEGSTLQEVLAPVIEWLSEASANDPGSFQAAADQVETLLAEQKETYETKRARVVKMCENQQAFVKTRRAADGRGGDGPGPRPDGASPGAQSKEWGVWLSRAKRLSTGDCLDLAEGGRGPRRSVRLAWIGEDFNPFVFVDAHGEKSASLSLQELAMHLRRGLAVVMDRPVLPLIDRALYTVLHGMHGSIEKQARHDPLTGFGNRRTVRGALASLLQKAAQDPDVEHAVCQLIIDGLDALEPEAAPEARRAVVQVAAGSLGKILEEGTAVARVEGDAFVFLVEDTSPRRARRLAQRLKRELDESLVAQDQGSGLNARIGMALVSYAGGDADDALARAEAAVGEARRSEDGIAVLEPDEDEADDREVMDWVTLINRSLGEDRMQLRCQRVSPLEAQAKPYYEVLLGLRDDDGNTIPSAEFVAAAEHHEQLGALDRWVIRNALRWMAANRGPVREVAGFTVKLTTQSIADDHLMEYVLEQLTATAVPPGKICFELTQAAALAHPDAAGRLVRTLREFGCRFSLAKFAGGEGLNLDGLPVDFLKIDGQFVREMAVSDADTAVVQSANELAHAAGLRTVAEFVEDEATLGRLRAIGVDYVQGIGVAPPTYLTELGPAPEPEPQPESRADPGRDASAATREGRKPSPPAPASRAADAASPEAPGLEREDGDPESTLRF